MNKHYDLIKSPIFTESTHKLIQRHNKYFFKVFKEANKIDIKKSLEKIFSVKIKSVNTLNVLPKFKRKGKYSGYTTGYKKAIIKLFPGYKIDIMSDI